MTIGGCKIRLMRTARGCEIKKEKKRFKRSFCRRLHNLKLNVIWSVKIDSKLQSTVIFFFQHRRTKLLIN